MKKLLFSCAVLWAFSGVVVAADIAEPAAYDWSGPYLGVHAGYLWGDVDVDYEGSYDGGEIDGFIGGGLAGFNYQSDSLVLGLEADFGLGKIDGTGGMEPDRDCSPELYSYDYDMDWNAHLRGRVGLAMDRTLLFVAGGLAVTGHELGVDECKYMGSGNATHYGFTIGGGVEHALKDNVLLRVEYLYDDYGSKRYNFGESDEDFYDVDIVAQTIRAALSIKF